MKKTVACIAFLFSAITVFAQADHTNVLNGPALKLKTFLNQHVIEKVYLHLDKPYYAAGDTMYFKAYVIAGEKNALSTLSGVLYADLINPDNKVVKAIKLPIINGLAWGDVTLPDSLPGGNYRLRAYTKLMQDYSNDLFFDKLIPIGAIINLPADKIVKSSRHVVADKLPDIQFFPEGGELIAGVASKVAFKAVIPGGFGINVSGTILNKSNIPVTQFASKHLGMGVFNLTPVTGETYHAEVIFDNGNKAKFDLPTVNEQGVAIAVYDSTSKISVHINPGAVFYQQNKNRPLGLFIYSGGRLTTVSNLMDGADMRFDIQKSGLRSGITQITLLSSEGEPLCERLVFINKNDKLELNIALDKKDYRQREAVKVNLHLQNADSDNTAAHFSVAVIDKSKVRLNEDKEDNISTYLLLTSCLKGYIEKPGYYFNNTDQQKRSELDLVMLTHGYRRFSWKDVLGNNSPAIALKPEKALSISGVAKSLSGKPLSKGLITLISVKGGSLLSENTNEAGAFSFKNLAFYDSTRFVINAINNKGQYSTTLVYKPELLAAVSPALYASTDTSDKETIIAYLENSKKQHSEYVKYYGPGIQLKQVDIKTFKKASYRTLSLAGAGNADAVIKGSDLTASGTLSSALSGRIGGVYFTGTDSPNGGVPKMHIGNDNPMLVIVDGIQLTGSPGNPAGINQIAPGDVETIEVLKYSSAAIYGIAGGAGVLIITTKQGVGIDAKDIVSRGVLPLSVMGFYKAREFYSPKYDEVIDHTRPDLRFTIHWLPEISPDKSGNASFNFYNADGTGQYQIIVEGINNNGITGIAKLDYQVK